MSLGQSMLATAALVVITILAINAYRIAIQSQEDELRGEAVRIAGDAATSLINEALTKKYDLNATKNYYQNTNEFTTSLGPSPTESGVVRLPDTNPFRSLNGYDDFDDYNGYTRTANTSTISGFSLRCVVSYVQSANPNVISTSQTYTKRLDVIVTNPLYLKSDSFTFRATMSY